MNKIAETNILGNLNVNWFEQQQLVFFNLPNWAVISIIAGIIILIIVLITLITKLLRISAIKKARKRIFQYESLNVAKNTTTYNNEEVSSTEVQKPVMLIVNEHSSQPSTVIGNPPVVNKPIVQEQPKPAPVVVKPIVQERPKTTSTIYPKAPVQEKPKTSPVYPKPIVQEKPKTSPVYPKAVVQEQPKTTKMTTSTNINANTNHNDFAKKSHSPVATSITPVRTSASTASSVDLNLKSKIVRKPRTIKSAAKTEPTKKPVVKSKKK
jgi:hypothetical protein